MTVLFKGQSFLIGRNTASSNVGEARDAPFSLKVDYTVQILGFLQMQLLLPLRNAFRSGNAVNALNEKSRHGRSPKELCAHVGLSAAEPPNKIGLPCV